MKIGITGPHGSGKSTLLSDLFESIPYVSEKLTKLQEITRALNSQGFDINESGTNETQIMVVQHHIYNILTEDDFIVDRILLDGYVYTKYLHDVEKVVDTEVLDYAKYLLMKYITSYDLILYVPFEIALVDDNVRSTNERFHQTVIKYFEEEINNLRVENPELPLYTIIGTREERVNKIKTILEGVV